MTAIDGGGRIADAMAWPRRAGLWRRSAAFLIDYLLVFLLLVAVVAALFRLTNGAIQGDFTLRFGACYEATVKWDEGPSPVPEYDTWKQCNTSLFGLVTASKLIGTSSSTGAEITLPIGPDGKNTDSVLNLGFIESIALFVYFFIMDWKTGEPIGKRVMAITVYDADDKHRDGLPSRKAVRRSWMKFLGAVPLTLLQGWYAFQEWGNTSRAIPEASNLETAIAFAALAFAPIWTIWIAISIALGDDPIHDRFAETTVRAHQAET